MGAIVVGAIVVGTIVVGAIVFGADHRVAVDRLFDADRVFESKSPRGGCPVDDALARSTA